MGVGVEKRATCNTYFINHLEFLGKRVYIPERITEKNDSIFNTFENVFSDAELTCEPSIHTMAGSNPTVATKLLQKLHSLQKLFA